jgi:hypothetical protein
MNQTIAEIAAYYRLPGVKAVTKFESRDAAITRIWAVLRLEPAEKPKVLLRDDYRLNLEKQAT